jgi:ABC-type multidrug transport system fused ATPase/permease subunit
MKEQMLPSPSSLENFSQKQELTTSREELMADKLGYYQSLKTSVQEIFGASEIPEGIRERVLGLRQEIKQAIAESEYLDAFDARIEKEISELADTILSHELSRGSVTGLDAREAQKEELIDSLRVYLDSYRLAHNAARFRKNVVDLQDGILKEHQARSLNFYAEDEKQSALADRVFKKYETAGFTKEEITELVATCHLERLDALEIQDLKIIEKIGSVFSRFMGGDKTRYVGLSAALMVPAVIEGYAPSVLADAFRENSIDLTQVGLFALLTSVAAGGSAFLQKQFKEFLDKNFAKEDGFGQYIAEGVAEFPGTEIGVFGAEKIKRRLAEAKSSYERVLRKISFDIVPAAVTLATSAAVLYQRSPALAAGTVVGTGMMMAVDHYVNKKGKFWDKRRRAKEEAERVSEKMNELLNAHMEVILSGEKDRFTADMEDLLSKERVALSDKTFMDVIRDRVGEITQMVNFVIAAMAAYIAGGTSDKFIAALMYSGRFHEGIATMLSAKQDLLDSLRDIVQMEVMFNGYAAEEKEKEKDRVGVSSLEHHDILLSGVEVTFGEKQILGSIDVNIPSGSFVSLEGISGSGKTTLLKVLAGYYRPTAGEVSLGDQSMENLKKSGPDSVYSKIAYLSQFPYVVDSDVRSNLTFGIQGDVSDDEMREVLQQVGLDTRFSNLRERLVGGRGDMGTASGGETSRIGLARTLLKMRKNGAKIVFLDEPTASVDEKTAAEIAKILNEEKKRGPEVTFIVISHDKHFREQLEITQKVQLGHGKLVGGKSAT